jgi:hypothetical protein
MSDTIYREQYVPDYRDNPLIEALPPIWSEDEVIDMLSQNGGHHDNERDLSPQHRLHCVHQLFRYFQPLEQHLSIERQFSICIRQGYLHRNPLAKEYAAALAQGHKTIVSGGTFNDLSAFRPTSAGYTIIGVSGVGKTVAVSNILALYPQVIEHTRYREFPLMLKQIVWLKLDCPHDGAVKGLCMKFFDEVDRAIGTNYYETHGRRTNTIDMLMVRMSQIARLHCIGVLVIDEIQHLSLAKGGGQEKMLNFFVTLVNTIGVPVVLIGTNKAMTLFQSEFRQARRGSSLIWDRMKNDDCWDIFVTSMWNNQWTTNVISASDDFKNELYKESQGITDIAVKLYAMVQIQAIALGHEIFKPSDFRVAVNEGLALAKPMLEALRSGDRKKIDMYGDIAPVSIDAYYAAYSAILAERMKVPEKRHESSLSEQAVLKLLEVGIEEPEAKQLTGKVLAEHLEFRKVSEVFQAAYELNYLARQKKTEPESQPDDLRGAVGYDSLKDGTSISKTEW